VRDFGNLSWLESPVFMRVLRDLLRDGEVNVLFPTWEQFIPNLGTFRSQGGNN